MNSPIGIDEMRRERREGRQAQRDDDPQQPASEGLQGGLHH
jgi:hypothetical protein